jgi:diguanylate cyclase (GGDEF)-like protein/PAS domain S-box-containing protein
MRRLEEVPMLITNDSHLPFAPKENDRLRALEEYAVFDTPPDVDLDRLVELAARMYGTPVAALSLVGKERLYFKSRFGMQATGIGREGSFCSFAIQNDGLFLVSDTCTDDRFASHPLVTDDPKIRFYAGIPLTAPSGLKIGTLCILDTKPWPNFTDDDRKNLEDVADLVMNRLELRRLDQAKQGGHERFERIASTSPDAIVGASSAGRINYWNEAAKTLFGYTHAEAMDQPISLIFPERLRKLQTAEVMNLVACRVTSPNAYMLSVIAQHRDGTEFPSELSLSIWEEGGEISFGAILRNVTDRDQGEQRLFGLAHLDPLTGLPNRAFLLARLEETVRSEAGTLMLLDLAGFKDVNDSLGHSVGDLLLTEAAERLRQHAGDDATVARTGADEFAILIPAFTDRVAAARHANEVLQLFTTPFALSGEAVHVGMNVGVAICPSHGHRVEELLANADLALQRSKATRSSGQQFYAPNLRHAVVARRSMEGELRQALAQSQFELFYQPQVRLADRSLVGAEALLRWRHPERGLLAPGDFLSVLEASPFAAATGTWVLDTACEAAARWRQMGMPDFRIAVNLFGAQFNTGDLPRRVEEALIRNRLPADALELEITENIMLRHDESILVPLRELCAWGVGIAFDDYGTGYASLSLLKRYPVTQLKIDKSFVRDLCTDAEDAAIIQAIMYLGRRLDLNIIAEGIETRAQEEALRLYGCTEAQGYLYGRPIPESALSDILRGDADRAVVA